MIECKNISKYFWNTQALKNINANIQTGKITGIIWENGAGKSTFMKILATSIIDYQGEIEIDKKIMSHNISNFRNIIWYMPDQYWLYQDMNVWEYLHFIAQLHNNFLDDVKIKEILQKVELWDYFDKNINELSRGMTQRVLLAQALINNPKILILDEPASWLDPRLRVVLNNILIDCKNNWVTVIISSHILSELENLVDNIIIINNWEITFNDTVNNLYKNNSSTIFIHTDNNTKAKSLLQQNYKNIEIKETQNWLLISNINSSQELIEFIFQNNISLIDFHSEYKNIQSAYISLTQ